MKPEFMRLRRALASTLAALLMAVGIVVLSPALSASAHDYSVTATCTEGLNVNLTSYPSGTDVSVVIDGDTVTDTSFSGNWSKSYPWDRNADHSYTVAVLSPDDLDGARNWSFTRSGTVEACPVPTPRVADTPSISATASGCSAPSDSTGSVSYTLTGVTGTYTVALISGGSTVATQTSTGGAGQFTGVSPGTYTVRASGPDGATATSGTVTVVECAPSTPDVSLALVPCLTQGTLGPVTAELSNLAVGNAYTVTLYTATDVELGSQPLTATAATATVAFPGHGAGEYYATVTDAGGLFSASANMTIEECPDLPTQAPPTIVLIADQCDADGIPPAPLTAQVSDLSAAQTYYVRIVDSNGVTVPGGADQTVTGTTTASVTFPGVFAPGTYTAQLRVNPGMQLAAASPAVVSETACELPSQVVPSQQLPTLAVTGPGELLPLGSLAALLLTLGGALVVGRLRRRMAL